MDLNRLWLLILLISVREIIAFPPLVTRGDGSLLDPIVDPVLGAIGGALTWGVGATIDGLSNLNNIPAPSPSLDQIPVPAADPAAAPAVDPSSPSTEQVPIPAADPAAPPSVEPSVNPAAERAPDTGMNPNTPVDQSQGTQGAQTYHLGIQNTQGTSSDVQLETNPSAQLPGNQKCEAALPSTGKGSPVNSEAFRYEPKLISSLIARIKLRPLQCPLTSNHISYRVRAFWASREHNLCSNESYSKWLNSDGRANRISNDKSQMRCLFLHCLIDLHANSDFTRNRSLSYHRA